MADFKIIAIDGGAASGKSSTAKVLCNELNYLHVDTGAHYRAVTFVCIENQIEPLSGPLLEEFLSKLNLGVTIKGNASLVSVNGEILNEVQIRREAVNQAVSQFAAIPEVREKVKAYQRSQADVAKAHGFSGLIMDGRDIGTVIFPNADLKVFLYADEQTRVSRRQDDGQNDQIAMRDMIDSKRKTAPLLRASDARALDNSHLSLNEVVAIISGWIVGL